MVPPRVGTPSGPWAGRRLAVWAALAVGWVLPSVGCQVEYAGMTLPSGKYMYDDVQYFPPGPDFPWANTQAATQRARMQAMGMEVPAAGTVGAVGAPPPAEGTLNPRQNVPNVPTDVNAEGFQFDRELPVQQPAPGDLPFPAEGGMPTQFEP